MKALQYLNLFTKNGYIKERSNSQWKRLIKQGGVTFWIDDYDCETPISEETIEDKIKVRLTDLYQEIQRPYWVKVGKREWIKLTWKLSYE